MRRRAEIMLMRIEGEEREGEGGEWIEIRCPATGRLLDSVPAGGRADLEIAVGAAERAFSAWSEKTQHERGQILQRVAILIRERYKDLARILTEEQGKPIKESRDEIRGVAHVLEYYAGISALQSGEAISLGAAGDSLVVRRPRGICAAIIPWNMPALIMAWKVGPALLAGNTFILKPASTSPLTNLHLASLFEMAGLPAGVLNLVTGFGSVLGPAISMKREIKKVSFTGSVNVGEEMRRAAALSSQEIILELGGSDPMIVMDDADLIAAAKGAIKGRFYNAGQTCTAVKRLYVHEDVVQQFTEMLARGINGLCIGNGLNSSVDMGPLHSQEQYFAISRLVERSKEREEGEILSGGMRMTGDEYDKGWFYRPTLIRDPPPESPLLREEVFGPVLPLMSVPDLETAIREANNTDFGLGASIWTEKLRTVRKVFDEVEAGIIWVNKHLLVPPEIPFGGEKASGIGRENGRDSLDGYTTTKTLFIGR